MDEKEFYKAINFAKKYYFLLESVSIEHQTKQPFSKKIKKKLDKEIIELAKFLTKHDKNTS